MIIKTPRALSDALEKLNRLQTKQGAIGVRISSLNAAILRYYERKHINIFKDRSGTVWRRQQGSAPVYNDVAFRKLLRKKHINPDYVYKRKIVIERDDAYIMQLLKDKKISVEEWKEVTDIRYFTPYLRKQTPRQGKSRGDNSDTDSGVSASEALSRVRNRG